MEKCDRCGEVAEDRRTLFMSCLYAMDELPIPFKQVAIRGVHQDHTDNIQSKFFNVTAPLFTDTPGCEKRTHSFYTLRVCKSCRASWMKSIEDWFCSSERREPTGTGVYYRANGATYEMSEQEIAEKWYR